LGLAPEVIKLSSPALCRFDARAALPADKRGYRTYLDELVPPAGDNTEGNQSAGSVTIKAGVEL